MAECVAAPVIGAARLGAMWTGGAGGALPGVPAARRCGDNRSNGPDPAVVVHPDCGWRVLLAVIQRAVETPAVPAAIGFDAVQAGQNGVDNQLFRCGSPLGGARICHKQGQPPIQIGSDSRPVPQPDGAILSSLFVDSHAELTLGDGLGISLRRPVFNHVLSVCTNVALLKSTVVQPDISFYWVVHRNSRRLEMPDVAGHHGQPVFQRSGSDQQVGARMPDLCSQSAPMTSGGKVDG